MKKQKQNNPMGLFHFRRLPLIPAAVFILLVSAAADIASDTAALIFLRSAVGSPILRWNQSSASPCSWTGVVCSPDGAAVVELRIPAKGLSGRLPPQAFSNMTRLRTLSLRYNSLTGPLPAAIFSSLTSLNNLYLQHNSFSGEIPDSLFALSGLINLNLDGNNFSGPIPSGFNNLTRLRILFLNHNNFSGTISDLRLPCLTQFNVSNNHLTGRIPAALWGHPASSFSGNTLCGYPLKPCHDDVAQIPPPKTQIPPLNRDDNNSQHTWQMLEMIIPSVLGSAVIIVFIGVFMYRKCQKGSSKDHDKGVGAVDNARIPTPTLMSSGKSESSNGNESSRTFRANRSSNGNDRSNTVVDVENNRLTFCGRVEYTFGLAELLGASAEVLGKGSHGMTYKAMVRMGPEMVVKRVKDVKMGAMEFKARIEDIGNLSHENLLPLRAYFVNGTECLLVYEYMPMGSLNKLLYDNNGSDWSPLTWKSRMAITHGVAKGILYLHSQGPNSAHGNIKSSNILLTPSYEAVVSDFGLAQFPGTMTIPLQSSTTHYRPPEATTLHDASQRGDIYCFGYLLFELLAGKMVTPECRNRIITYGIAMSFEYLANDIFGTALVHEPQLREDVIKVIQLILLCTAENPNDRPLMVQVSDEIEEIWSRSAQYGMEVFVNEDEEELGVHSTSSST